MGAASKMAGALIEYEFDTALAKFPRLSDKGKSAARAILVEGQAIEHIARELGVSRQMVYAWASKIYKVFEPVGWVTASVTLPPEQMDYVRTIELEARSQWEKSLRPPRVVRRRST